MKKVICFLISFSVMLAMAPATFASNEDAVFTPVPEEIYYGLTALREFKNPTPYVEMYYAFKNAAKTYNTKLNMPKNVQIAKKILTTAYYAFTNDYPQYDIVEYSFEHNPQNIVTSVSVVYNEHCSAKLFKIYDKVADDFIKDCRVTPDMSDYEKVKRIHDRLAAWVDYELIDDVNNTGIYPTLIERKTVCGADIQRPFNICSIKWGCCRIRFWAVPWAAMKRKDIIGKSIHGTWCGWMENRII